MSSASPGSFSSPMLSASHTSCSYCLLPDMMLPLVLLPIPLLSLLVGSYRFCSSPNRVGKTSLMNQYVNKRFSNQYKATIGEWLDPGQMGN